MYVGNVGSSDNNNLYGIEHVKNSGYCHGREQTVFLSSVVIEVLYLFVQF